MRRLGILIPARGGSARLPFKHLYPLDGDRNALSLFATTFKGMETVLCLPPSNRLYAETALALGMKVFMDAFTPEEEVLTRLWKASAPYDRVCIVNGDSPLVPRGLVRDLLNDPAPFVITDGVPGLRPLAVDTSFLEYWHRTVLAQQTSPFSLFRACELSPIRRWVLNPNAISLTLDTWEDVLYLRKVIAEGALGAETPEEILSIARKASR